MPRPCKHCQSKDHTQFYCRLKPRKPIPKISEKKKQGKKKSQSKSYGTKKEWDKTKAEWKKQNPPDEYGYWYCKFGGGRLDDGKSGYYGNTFQFQMCHDKSRARHPELKFDLDNLFAGCGRHNKIQGSRSFDEFLEEAKDIKCGDY